MPTPGPGTINLPVVRFRNLAAQFVASAREKRKEAGRWARQGWCQLRAADYPAIGWFEVFAEPGPRNLCLVEDRRRPCQFDPNPDPTLGPHCFRLPPFSQNAGPA